MFWLKILRMAKLAIFCCRKKFLDQKSSKMKVLYFGRFDGILLKTCSLGSLDTIWYISYNSITFMSFGDEGKLTQKNWNFDQKIYFPKKFTFFEKLWNLLLCNMYQMVSKDPKEHVFNKILSNRQFLRPNYRTFIFELFCSHFFAVFEAFFDQKTFFGTAKCFFLEQKNVFFSEKSLTQITKKDWPSNKQSKNKEKLKTKWSKDKW